MRSVRWRRLDREGTDRATLAETHTGHLLLGHARFGESGKAYQLHYSAEVDSHWRTVQARVDGLGPDGPIAMHIGVEPGGIWRLNGRVITDVLGSVDIDLAFTPATNLLSVRRLALSSGQSGEVIAAWLDFPRLRLEPLRQIYRLRPDGRYDYSCPELPFDSTLEVDSAGFVTAYPPLWGPP